MMTEEELKRLVESYHNQVPPISPAQLAALLGIQDNYKYYSQTVSPTTPRIHNILADLGRPALRGWISNDSDTYSIYVSINGGTPIELKAYEVLPLDFLKVITMVITCLAGTSPYRVMVW